MAKDCWESAAQGHIAQKSNWHAAKAMERAGEMARDAGNYNEVQTCFRRAAELYLEEGRPNTASEAMVKAAKALESADPAAASKLYDQALEWVEDGGKEGLAADTYRSAIGHAVRSERWAEAVAILVRFAAACLNVNAMNSLCKSYLGAVVVWLHAGDANAAWCTYQDALGVVEFSTSSEAVAAEELLNAYRAADIEAIAGVVSSQHCFTHLEPCIARLAKKLPRGQEEILQKMAQQLMGVGGGGGGDEGAIDENGEEDLT
jgi:gamma-soluble NSF attachment protein